MFNRQQFSNEVRHPNGGGAALFNAATGATMNPGSTAVGSLFQPDVSVGRSMAMPSNAPAPALLEPRTEIRPWYLTKRVWVAAAILTLALGVRVAAPPEQATLQSAVISAEGPVPVED